MADNVALLTNPPLKWASIPEWMTFSFANDAEQCPRRAMLRRSDYGDLWVGTGYPPGFSLHAVLGVILHSAVRRLVTILANRGCGSIREPFAFEILKSIGGYSSAIRSEVDEWLSRCDANPRLAKRRGSIQQRLERVIPELRLALQRVLLLTEWSVGTGNGNVLHQSASPVLGVGAHFEVELVDLGVKWKGFADLVEISADRQVKITEFKSGKPKKADEQQLRLYALLWAHDKRKNPNVRLANRLVICYPGHVQEVEAPSEDELVQIERECAERSEAIRQALKNEPPAANVSVETCPREGLHRV